jgi:hypothetical protein
MQGKFATTLLLAIVTGALILLYNYFPDHRGLVIFSALLGLALTTK